MHVLHLGCGRALSSILLAREYGVELPMPRPSLMPSSVSTRTYISAPTTCTWIICKSSSNPAAKGDSSPEVESDIQVLEADGGRYLGFIRTIGQT
jgi:hypothetical protein